MSIAVFHVLLILMCLSISSCQTKAKPARIIVYPVEFKTVISDDQGRYGWPKLNGRAQYLYITCLEDFRPVVYPRNQVYRSLSINKCQIPKKPLAEQLQTPKINITALLTLQFTDVLMDSPLPTDFTRDLSVIRLGFNNPTNFHPLPEFFTSLTKLRELIFENMEVPTLPPSTSLHLAGLTLKNSLLKNWDNCERLEYLEIEGLTKEQMPKEWPTNCTQLRTLGMAFMPLEAVYHVIETMTEESLSKLETLSIRNCSLEQLPLKLTQSKNLSSINLSNNKLKEDALLQFPQMNSLKFLSLTNNRLIFAKDLLVLLPKTPGLQELEINGTSVQMDHLDSYVRAELAKLKSLEKLYLNGNGHEDVFKHNHFEKLSFLSMRTDNMNYYIDFLKLHDFPSTGAQQLDVDLSGISVNFVSIGPKFVENFDSIYGERRTRFWITNKGYKLVVHLSSIDCDCNNDVLWRALREFPHFLAMPNLKCSHGGLFKDEPLENLNCRKATVNGCLRIISRGSNHTTVDCSNNPEQFRWPRPWGFQKLIAAGNNITSLEKAYLPASLKWLDLRNNSISRLNGEQVSHLFGYQRRVWLAGNPIVCDCDNQPLLDALHRNQSWIMDYDILKCADSGQLLSLVSLDELCRARSMTLLIAVSVLSLLGLVAALLVRHYWSTLRMILYAHGCCVSCLQEKDSDEDRPYDAFISFAHGDDKYVTEELLPRLEDEQNRFRVCIHYRDWVIGEPIPVQILKSVQLSKRTIIVLSKNFVESCWGMMEFRHANAGAMASGSQRLIVLVLGDVPSEKLTPELRGYLELNTYLKCDDPWFWEKLLYAMPHKDGKKKDHFENTCRSRANAFAQYIPQLEGGSMKVEEPADTSLVVDICN